MNKMFAELTFSSQGNGDEDVKKILNFFLKEFKSGDKLNLSINKMTLEVLFKEVPPVDFIKSMFEHARVEKITIAPIKGAGEAETAETEAEAESEPKTEAEAEAEAETEAKAEAEQTEAETAAEAEAEQKAEAEKKAETETAVKAEAEAEAKAEAEQNEAETAAEEKAAPPLKKRGRPRKTETAVTEPKTGEEVSNFPILRGKLGLALTYKRMEELIKEMDVDSATRPERQKKMLKALLYGTQKLRKEGRDIIVDDILVNNGISENDAAMCRMVASSWVNAYALTHGCKEKIKLEDFLKEVSKLN